MHTSVYVLTDGTNSKTGISTNIESRLQAYRTHNPNFSVYGIKSDLDEDVARRIEAIVKAAYSHAPSANGKEWFRVRPEDMMRVVDFHLSTLTITAGKEPLVVAAGFVPLTEKAAELLSKAAPDGHPDQDIKNLLMNEFAVAFSLGVPEHRLPETIALREIILPVDTAGCDWSNRFVKDRIEGRREGMPYDDHVRNFYHLIELKSGYHVALCTATVSMPYPSRLADMPTLLKQTDACGLRVFQHDKWSWHFPGVTHLLLYLQKTPIADRVAAFELSFRRWVIEKSNTLSLDATYTRAVEDIVNDATFPLDATNWDDLYSGYLLKISAFNDWDYWRPIYMDLFHRWSER